MKNKKNQIDPLPDDFNSYEEAAEFWDEHDTTDYLMVSRPVKVVSEFRVRQYEIEIDIHVAKTLRAQAKRQGVKPSQLATELLRRQLTVLAKSPRAHVPH